jgi:hypothetical protein
MKRQLAEIANPSPHPEGPLVLSGQYEWVIDCAYCGSFTNEMNRHCSACGQLLWPRWFARLLRWWDLRTGRLKVITVENLEDLKDLKL